MSYPPLIDLRIGFWPVVHFIRPCPLFPIDNLSIYAQIFFKFCIHIVIGDEWYGIVNGQNPTIFDGVTALSPFKKWFLACYSFTVYDIWMKLHRYVEQQRLHITTKDRHSYLSSSWVIRPWLIWKMFLTCSSFTIWNIWMKLHRYVDHQRLHIVTKDVISLSISVLLLFRHYISHKITFGAPSSGGVLCSACGAFIWTDIRPVHWFQHLLHIFSMFRARICIRYPRYSSPKFDSTTPLHNSAPRRLRRIHGALMYISPYHLSCYI